MKVSAFAIDFEGSLADLILAPVKLAGLYAQAVQRAEKMGFKDYQLSLNSNFSSSCSLSCRVPRSVPRDCVRGLQCSSCDVNLSLATLLGASAKSPLDDIPNSVLLLLAGEHARAWLDAKKRAMVVVTPKRHVERISELEGNELELCMKDLAKALEHCAHSITRIVVNQGACQNHPHLHWKALMIQGSFKELLLSLPSEQQSVYKNAMRAVKAAKRSGVLSKKNR